MSVILIPAYKPSKELITLVQKLLDAHVDSIVVVDDGSGEEYRQTFALLPSSVHVIVKKQNCGKGAAIKTALGYIRDNFAPEECVITCDADAQHTPHDIMRVAEAAESDRDALILGVRTFGKGTPFKSFAGNLITRGVFLLATGRDVRDTQTGLRGFCAQQIPWLLSLEGERYEYEINMLLFAARRRMNIHTVDIETVYIDNNSSSHFHPWRDSAVIYGKILRFSLSSIVSFFIDFILLFAFRFIFAPLGAATALLCAVVAARALSSLANFTLNRTFVFARGENSSVFKYYALVAFILGLNYGCMYLLTERLTMPLFWAKLITEGALFIVSYNIQKHFVFGKKFDTEAHKKSSN